MIFPQQISPRIAYVPILSNLSHLSLPKIA